MAAFVKGEIVVVPFPFSDLTQVKRRPALVITPLQGDDVILCQITSRALHGAYAIPLESTDFTKGSLNQPSNIRPNRLFTADSNIILYSVGHLQPTKVNEVIEAIVTIIRI